MTFASTMFRILLGGIALLAIGGPAWAQSDSAAQGVRRLPFGLPTPVRVTVDDASALRWMVAPHERRSGDSAIVRPVLLVLDGIVAGPVDRDSLELQVFVPGDAERTTAAGRTWHAVAPWSAIVRVERREDDEKAISRRGRRGALTGALVGTALGALVAGRNRVGGAVVGGLFSGWSGYVVSAQGASVSAPPCWRLAYSRELATEREAAGEPPHVGRNGPRTCPSDR